MLHRHLMAWCRVIALVATGAMSNTAAQLPRPDAESAPGSVAIAPADIPARADLDEPFVQAVVRRAQAAEAAQRFEQALASHAAAVEQLAKQSRSDDLTLLAVRRLESLRRHWLLFDRGLSASRTALQQATKASAEDAAALASRRTAWSATELATAGAAPALLQHAGELIVRIDSAEKAVSGPLAKLLELGRKGNTLSVQVQSTLASVTSKIGDEDRRLLSIDAPPLWDLESDASPSGPLRVGLRESLAVETALARDHDAANRKLLRVLVTGSVLLLPLLLWLRHRAAHLVATAPATAPSVQALSHPWAAWLVLVAAGTVLYDLQGPVARQQAVMMLAWVPVLRLLPTGLLTKIGPWAYLSAGFYGLNVLASMLIGSPMSYRWAMLTIDVLMLATLIALLLRARRSSADGGVAKHTPNIKLLVIAAGVLLLTAVLSNLLGNVSLATMLTGAVLDINYGALGLYASATELSAIFRVVLGRPTVSRLTTRHAGSLIHVAANVGRTLLVVAWAVFALQSLRIYRPLVDTLTAVLTDEFKLGVVSLSLGSVVAFVASAWLAFWLAKTIRMLLADDVLPALSLPRGVGNSISTLSYYTILFLGLLAALAVAGFQVGQLAIVFGALGVGIGFGLQDIVKNFVSGLILMFERPIQPGDVVDVAGMSGTVREIGMRATIITTFQGAEVVVPNGLLLADNLVNWTLRGNSLRIDVSISTGYDSAPQRTCEVLVAAARSLADIASQPPPVAILTELGRDALEFNLRAWTVDRADWLVARSNLAAAIRDALAGAGIEVPRPQRELHLSDVSEQAASRLAAWRPAPAVPG